MSVVIINDVHLGVKRQGGTTPQTQQQLRDYLQDEFRGFMSNHRSDHVVIAGDLFDNFDVDPRDLLNCFETLSWFLESPEAKITLIAGNHDWSPRGDKLSGFHLLAGVLPAGRGTVQLIDRGLTGIDGGVWAIPHMSNQDLFDMALAEALALAGSEVKHLILHANYDNKFTLHSDHSLNVSREKAMAFAAAGCTLIFAHEHQAKSDLGGMVRVLGNQWPSSIADCLHNVHKFAHRLYEGELAPIETWSREGTHGFSQVSWRDLNPEAEAGEGFIRVTGEAAAAEAEAVVEAIAKYRTKSTAFVVGNVVKVEGMADMDAISEVSAESIKAFDVLAALLNELTEREQEVVRSLL
jgi:hypothetical protein